jgi:transitional endoplasmic reticulum ATPase
MPSPRSQIRDMLKNALEESEVDRTRARVLANLAELGNLTTGDDDLIYEGSKIILPEAMRGRLEDVVEFLGEYMEQQDATFNYVRTFNFRPWDGAAAFARAMKLVFGTTGTGRSQTTMFGRVHPSYITVPSGPGGETVQVPAGQVHLDPLEATFTIGATMSNEYGSVSQIRVEAPKKFRAHIVAFLDVVQAELDARSIYRGKAFTGGAEPEFLDVRGIDPAKVVYSEEVTSQLDTELWSLLRYADTMREQGMTLKRAVLVEGQYGTGKTLTGELTARMAVQNGWTFVIARPGKDDIGEVLQTAQLYAPSVVWFEDVDVVAEGDSPAAVSRLLDVLDGITNKSGTEVITVLTTNHVDKIHKAVLRPGRIDAVIQIGGLDPASIVRLIQAKIPAETLADDIDWDKVAAAFADYLPAFIAEGAGRAYRSSLARNKGHASNVGTEDLVYAAMSLARQQDLMNDALEGKPRDTLSEVVQATVRTAIGGTRILDGDDYPNGRLEIPKD